MDIAAIVLCSLKKWKGAFIVSIIGSILILFLIPYVPLWWISGIIYLATTIISAIGLFKSKNRVVLPPNNSITSSKTIEIKLTQLNNMLLNGLITKEEYDTLRDKTLNFK